MEISEKVVLCVNLMDERKEEDSDFICIGRFSLGIPVVGPGEMGQGLDSLGIRWALSG
jgi:hypothetical protein